jgi:hypothetical protein
MASPFSGQAFALLTRHGKETIFAPLLEAQLGASLRLTQDFDTDQLGTFSGDVERQLSPKDCALKKAQLACELTGLNLGLGSEGSFGASPYGFGTVNHELVACVNRQAGWSVVGHHYNFSSARSQTIHSAADLHQFVAQTPPNQGLLLRCAAGIAKGLHGVDAVEACLKDWFGNGALLGSAFAQELTISDDLRAHQCPERRENIHKAMENLIARLLAPCPSCKTPGFWPDQAHSGLPCRACGCPTNSIKAHTAHCAQCNAQQTYPVSETEADPSLCPLCNP